MCFAIERVVPENLFVPLVVLPTVGHLGYRKFCQPNQTKRWFKCKYRDNTFFYNGIETTPRCEATMKKDFNDNVLGYKLHKL